MKKYIFIFVSLIAVVCGAITCCGSASERAAQDEAALRAQQSAERERQEWKRLQEALKQAAGARWVVKCLCCKEQPSETLPLPPAEWAVLKQALAHAEVVPPAAQQYDVCIMYREWVYLVLVDAKGREIYKQWMKDPFHGDPHWMPRSEAEALSPDRRTSCREAMYSLPDADYKAVMALPSFAKIYDKSTKHQPRILRSER